jgi:hypothetical protein
MITLTCSKCQRVLQIDDAFAGGVCRCKHCGTIQTVAAENDKKKSPNSPAANVARDVAKPASQVHPPVQNETPPATGTSLQDLAQIVASSGLAGTGLRSGHLRKPIPKPALNSPLLIAGGAIILIAVSTLLTWWLMRPGSTPVPQNSAQNTAPTISSSTPAPQSESAKPPQPTKPSFMGIPLKGPSVVFLLDRGMGTLDTFDAIKAATAKSLPTLGSTIKFQLIFWETDAIVEYPPDGLRDANNENVKAAVEKMTDIFAWGQSKIDRPLEKALAQNPAEIVIATGKNGLDDDFVKLVLDQRKNSPTKIHAISVGPTGSPDALKKIADKTGGQFREISGQALRDVTE